MKIMLLFCAIAQPYRSGDRVTVRISDGEISGLEDVTDDRGNTFWSFRGIPYAEPPVGVLRFEAPQPVKQWSGVYDGTYRRSICMQVLLAAIMPVSEDCLFVNVYTTNLPEQNATLLPVMFYIHGGGFTAGWGFNEQHAADRFLDHGVVLVTINYRLNVFGFFSTMDSASPGNYGLKDQIAALKWVRKNIAAFGGDPNRVTIFGVSAGSASVHYLMQTPLSKGLYQAGISESGSTLTTWAVAQDARQLAFHIGEANLIFTGNSRILVDHLKNIRAARLLATANAAQLLRKDSWNGLAWSPCIESGGNDAVVTEYSYPLLNGGLFNRVPLMTGFNSLEGRAANTLSWLVTLYSVDFNIDSKRLVPKDMNATDVHAAASKIKEFYFENKFIANNTAFIKYASDTLFVRGINKHVELISQYVPVYYYRFAFTGGSRHNPVNPPGASHGEEVQFQFNLKIFKQYTPEAILTQERILTLWTNFAKYRNPTPTIDPVLGDVIWPAANSTDGYLPYLNINCDLVVSDDPEARQMDFWDQLYNRYGQPPYNSY